MAYTAEDFERCRNEAAFTTWNDGEEMIIRAALSIAFAVMRRGVIEDEIYAGPDINSKLPGSQWRSDVCDLAAAIRAALTDAKP